MIFLDKAEAENFKMGVGIMIELDWRIMPRFGWQFDWFPSHYFVNDSYFTGCYSAFSAHRLFGRKD